MSKNMVTIDGNTAAAHIAYAFSDIAAIYPITPSSNMGEYSDEWAAQGKKNLFGKTVDVVEMQSEAGAAGAVHGSLSAGALTTTFTASQGLLLMIPNMYKIAGEMLPTVFHVSARSLAAQSLSIFGDHSDVMSVRNTGWAMTCGNSIQETMDMATIAHLSTLKAQVPFLNFFDGFRTSHELQKVENIEYDDLKELIEPEYIERFRARALRPEKPTVKVAAQNPDVYFQGRETSNKYYDAIPEIVQEYMDVFAAKFGRKYNLFDYVGAADAEKVIIAMGSACDTVEQTIEKLNAKGEKLGLVKVRLYRPFSAKAFVDCIPESAKKIIVLDRTKEPGALGEPLYLDVVTALEGKGCKIIGGRYGLSSKEFSPAMVKAVYDHADNGAWHNFTVGIHDDVTNLSIPVGEEFNIEPDDVKSAVFWGFGSDGTVGACKNTIKIIGDNTAMTAQAYFVYDSKKSGGVTTSHLRFGESSVNYPYLIQNAGYVACHNVSYIGRYDMLGAVAEGGTFVLNSEIPTSEVFNHLTKEEQQIIIDRKINFYNVNALKIALEVGLGFRINTVMQTVYFKLSGVLPEDEAIQLIKDYAKKTFERKGMDIVEMNWKAIDAAAAAIEKVEVPSEITESYVLPDLIPADASDFTKDVILPTMQQKGDSIPVSKMTFDGTLPTGTTKLEKRGIGPRVPKWLSDNCIQCNQCIMACPHAVIRAKQINPAELEKAPESFKTVKSKTKNESDLEYKIQVYIEDCTGCGVCVETCPAKTKALEFTTLDDERAAGEVENTTFFENLPDNNLEGVKVETVKGIQMKKPLFEFSGACAGCGETPYVKLVSLVCGEHMLTANATGCSSIYGGTFPTIPYCTNKDGRGPAWANSLFEDNAEYGLGFRIAVDNNRALLRNAVAALLEVGTTVDLKAALEKAVEICQDNVITDEAIAAQNAVKILLDSAMAEASAEAAPLVRKIKELEDYFVDKAVWIFGGDGWAYDIGYGGLDHVVASGKNVNILVLDTEVYSNTGGQASKSTPIGAVAKFATGGMRAGKKNLGFMCMSYGTVYVAHISMGANRVQTQKAIQEAVAYEGPSIIIAYAPCIAHGIDMMKTQTIAKEAVECGYWPLYRYNPAAEEGSKFTWDARPPKGDFQTFIRNERRYSTLLKTAPNEAEDLFALAEKDAKRRWDFMQAVGPLM
ncbi:pyruvate:ferredoxin (flavodoxin) oxidoreductase [Pontiella agarivorans]|uniref:Pyruvate:ferredoxin (Flavodoxin) oxidoreductase n=1 Tax=Pontiella agarivorans TaxID=3038953 RepID=A0ABU5MSP2_9BACT|nr:pyruvate:ferredoxin (flavodoxin) oxidoreductase [Pontiella agarivorans]MDZ8117222.1 pyruvate:ferredoxin (flavodoxin) oxidoreductase [Pontiella agarivorans]